jgi:hypothetical protein
MQSADEVPPAPPLHQGKTHLLPQSVFKFLDTLKDLTIEQIFPILSIHNEQ